MSANMTIRRESVLGDDFSRGRRRESVLRDDISPLQQQIQATHDPDGRFIDCKLILKMAEDIFNSAMQEGNAATEQDEEEQQDGDSNLIDKELSRVIDGLSIEMTYRDGDVHSKAMSILYALSNFSWEAKLLLTLLALALIYGKTVLLNKVYSSDKLPESMAILKGNRSSLESIVPALNDLFIAMLSSAKCIVQFPELLSMSSSLDVTAISTATDLISIATYWTIRAALSCASKIADTGTERIISASETWELSSLRNKIAIVKEQLENQSAAFRKHIEEKAKRDAYEALSRIIKMQHTDNLKVLEELLCAKEDKPPLYDGSKKTMVNLDVLMGKNVLLLISELNIAQDSDVSYLRLFYDESLRADNEYELVWVPFLDPSDNTKLDIDKTTEANRAMMPWYSLNHPETIDQTVKKLIMEEFNYKGVPVIVVLDPRGAVVNTNAIDMIMIWGKRAFPFSQDREQELWKGVSMGLHLIIDDLHKEIENRLEEEQYTLIYGGMDRDWMKGFSISSVRVWQRIPGPLKIVYVGKKWWTTHVDAAAEQKLIQTISEMESTNIRHFLPDISTILRFWKRLEHIRLYKTRLGSSTREDPVLHQGVTKILAYNDSGDNWASLFKGNELVVTARGQPMLDMMKRYLDQSQQNRTKPFHVVSKEFFDSEANDPSYTTRLIFPGSYSRILDAVPCPDCGQHMDKHIMFIHHHGAD